MNYRPRNRSKHPYSKKILFLAGVFVAGAIFFYFLEPFFVPLISPLWKTENAVVRTLSKSADFFRSRQALIDENVVLKEKVLSLELEISSARAAAGQRELLFSLFGRREEGAGIIASVLVRPPQSPYDSLIVDAGSRDGISLEARVNLPEGPELGIVSEVFSRQSRVKLFTSDGEETAAVLERHGVPVTLIGIGGGNFRIVVPRETQVEIGDRILSANISSNLLAVVGNVSLKPTDFFKEVLAKSPANIFTVRFVEILP